MRSRTALYFFIASMTAACVGFDVPAWTRPAGQEIEATEPEVEEAPSDATDGEDAEARPSRPEESPQAPPPPADSGVDSAPEDAGPG